AIGRRGSADSEATGRYQESVAYSYRSGKNCRILAPDCPNFPYRETLNTALSLCKYRTAFRPRMCHIRAESGSSDDHLRPDIRNSRACCPDFDEFSRYSDPPPLIP